MATPEHPAPGRPTQPGEHGEPGRTPAPPPTANTGAVGTMGAMFQDTDDQRVVPRRQVYSWALWDWATQPFNSVLLTFVFASLYLVSDAFLPADVAALADDDPVKQAAMATLSSGYGLATFIAGILILVLAPVLGVLTRIVVDVGEASGVELELSSSAARTHGGFSCPTLMPG